MAESDSVAQTDDKREAYYRTVFEEFSASKKKLGESTEKLAYEKFAKKLRKNTADLMARPGSWRCTSPCTRRTERPPSKPRS